MLEDIGQLTGWGISARAIAAWRTGGVERLLPLQQAALREHGFLHGRDLLVVAPTASGKTLVAEMAAVRHLEANRRVVYLTPTRALAEEKFREFRARYGPQGYRVAVATRERRDADRVVMEGRFDLLVAVYEKMKAYLVSRPEMLGGVGLVVADEVQTLDEPGRGGMIDLLLTKIARAPHDCQLIALSAVVGTDAPRLAEWLGCEMLHHASRPVELREGVYDLSSGVFRYRGFNGGAEGEERLAEGTGGAYEVAEEEMADFGRRGVFELVEALARGRGEQVLVFVPTRYTARNWAHLLAGWLDLGAADGLAREIEATEDSHAREWLREMAMRGVAFHNADVPWDLRELIEHHFNTGDLRVLVSTSTLGQGVNLSGRNVIHAGAMVTTDDWTGRQAVVALSRRRYRNQGGRGARSSGSGGFGRSILVARHGDEAERLLRQYVAGDMEGLEGRIGDAELEHCVLDLVVSRVARTPDDLTAWLSETFTGRRRWRRDSAELAKGVETAASSLRAAAFLTDGAGGVLEATGLGEVAASTGLDRSSVERLVGWLRQDPAAIREAPLEALLVMASTTDGREFACGGRGDGRRAEALVGEVRERLLGAGQRLTPMVSDLLSPEGGFSREAFADVRKACLMERWIGETDTREIEEAFGVFSGTAANLALHFAWIAQGAAGLARALVAPEAAIDALETLTDRLVLGAAEDAAGLRALRVQGMSRSTVRVLVREGFATPVDVAAADTETLTHLMPPRVAERLLDEARRMVESGSERPPERKATREERTTHPGGEEPAAASADAKSAEPETGNPRVLEVDMRGTGRARYDGRTLDLPRLPFRLLALLARSPRVGVGYEEIERTLWPDAQVERQQVLSHRRRILSELGGRMGRDAARRMIEVKAGRGLVLNADPRHVRVIGT